MNFQKVLSISAIIFIYFSINLSAHEVPPYYKLLQEENPNIYQIHEAYDAYYKTHEWKKDIYYRAYREFIRAYNLSDFDTNGNPLTPSLMRERNNQSSSRNSSQQAGGEWKAVPVKIDRNDCYAIGQNGVVAAIDVDRHNHNVIYVGSIVGQLWKSTNKGINWSENLIKNLPKVGGINEIKIAPNNSSVVYVATDVGILKSTNGGNNFSMTSLDYRSAFPHVNYGGDDYRNEYMFVDVAHNNANKVVATDVSPNGLNSKIAVSSDGGQSWTKHDFGHKNFLIDVSFHPSNSNIIYTLVLNKNSSHIEFYKSTNSGQSFQRITNGFPSNNNPGKHEIRARIGLSAAQPNLVALYLNVDQDGYGFYKSTNSGDSFSKVCCGSNNGAANKASEKRDFFGEGMGAVQIRWATKFAISDTDPNFVVAATNKPPRVSFNQMQDWYWTADKVDISQLPKNVINPSCSSHMHGDIKDIIIRGNDIWVANDGGLNLSENKGNTFVERGDGLPLTMALGFDMTEGKRDVIVAAMDHNGVIVKDQSIYGDRWKPLGGGDASNASVNPIDDYWVYARPSGNAFIHRPRSGPSHGHPSYNNPGFDLGNGYRSRFNNIQVHPNHYYTLYLVDYTNHKIKKSTNNGANWQDIHNTQSGSDWSYSEVKVSHSNPDVLYVIDRSNGNNKLDYSSNGGQSWISRLPTLHAGYNPRNIEIDSENPNVAWLTLNNGSTPKVYKTTNGGQNWTDYSAGLGGYSIISIVHQKGSNQGVYVGTKLGVYYRDKSKSSWEKYGYNLPGKGISFLKINYAHGKLRAGTIAGIWENGLYTTYAPEANISVDKREAKCGEYIHFADYSAALANASYNWSFPGGSPSSSTAERPIVQYNATGTYSATLTVRDANGSDTYTYNGITISGSCEAPFENLDCNNTIPKSGNVLPGNSTLIKDFSIEEGNTFYANIEVGNDCYGTKASLSALIDVTHNKITASKYIHFNESAPSPISGNETASVSSNNTDFGQVAFEISNGKLYLKNISNACGNVAMRVTVSCWDDLCANTIEGTDWTKSEIQIMDFSGAQADKVYLSLEAQTGCYNTVSTLRGVLDFTSQTIQVEEYFHFNANESSNMRNNGTAQVTSPSESFASISYRLAGTKLYLRQNSNPCSASTKLLTSCWWSLSNSGGGEIPSGGGEVPGGGTDYENLPCNNTIPATSGINNGQSRELIDFSYKGANPYFVKIQVNNSCYGTKAYIHALVDVRATKNSIDVLKYIHYERTANSAVLGNGTASITSVDTHLGQVELYISNKRLYLKNINNACGSAISISASCWVSTGTCFQSVIYYNTGCKKMYVYNITGGTKNFIREVDANSSENITVELNGKYAVYLNNTPSDQVDYFVQGDCLNDSRNVDTGGCDPCANLGGDSDGDGICDDYDTTNGDCTLGAACDDGDACTTGETYNADCNCTGGEFQDSDGDGICNTDDQCPDFDNALIGTPCDDGDACTTGETYGADCNCTGGQTQDSDGDGICDAEDNCPNFDNALIGTPCDDGDACTTGETYDADCNCTGGQTQDSDGDSICDNDDCAPNNPNYPQPVGTTCDDGNANTINDRIQSDGCTCEGTFDICATKGGDSDGDGICDNDDCAPDDPNYPQSEGTTCDDGDSNTINDEIQADGCTCQGILSGGNTGGNNTTTLSCGGNTTITYGNGEIKMEGGSFYQIFDKNWQEVFNCGWQCGNSQTVSNLAAGEYIVYIKNSTYQNICEQVITLTNGSDNTGSNDPDNDGDGGGSSGNNITCVEVAITYGGGAIAIEGQSGQEYYFKINDLNAGWAQAGGCVWNCRHQLRVAGLANSKYLITIFNSDWSKHCDTEIEMSDSNFSPSTNSRNADHLSFAAYQANREVELQWLTNSGYKVTDFEIERSTDGENFNPIEQFTNKEWSDELAYHQTIDEQPTKGTNYYRVKEIYLDGSFAYTDIQKVGFEIDLNGISVFPNPAKKKLFINLKPFIGKKGHLTIRNQFGQIVKEMNLSEIKTTLLKINTSQLNNGLYYLTIDIEQQRALTEKVLIHRLY